MVLAEFSMFPTDKGESVSKYVAQILDIIDRSGLNYQLTGMGTVLEGSWDDVMKVITDCFKKLEPQSNRITTFIKTDYRKGDESRMTAKVKKVEKILNRSLKSTR
ncbi:MAG: MTH1187 family thiamine-binding protein [Calditrichia bacterium]